MTAENPENTQKPAARTGGAGTILGALAVVAAANLAVALALGGYEFTVLGHSVRAHNMGSPLFILTGLLAVRALISLGHSGFRKTFMSFLPWGAVTELLVVGAFVYMAFARGTQAQVMLAVKVGALTWAMFVLAWVSWAPGGSGATRLIIILVSVSFSAALGDSLRYTDYWDKTFRVERTMYVSGDAIPSDSAGLLFGNGTDVRFAKIAVDADWRDAAALSPGGFFSAEVDGGQSLLFSVARETDKAGSTASVTLVDGARKENLWESAAADVPEDEWLDVSVEIPAGGGKVVFETDESGDGEVFFANPHVSNAAAEKQTVVLIVVDTLRADRLSLYGNTRPTCPEIEDLAAKAIVFDACVAQGPWTLPSMGTILTSLSPSAHGYTSLATGFSNHLDTLAERLRAEGYFTGAIQANALLAPEQGLAQGFNTYHHLGSKVWTVEDKGKYATAGVINSLAIEWLGNRGAGKSFLYLHYMDPHKPYVPVEGYDQFGSDDLALYDGEIAYFSGEFRKLYEAIITADPNAFIIVTSDHGEQFMEHGMNGHGAALHSEELHVPLVVFAPETDGGVRVKSQVSLIDIAPTVLDLAGLDGLEEAQGSSLAEFWSGGGRERTVFSELVSFRPVGQYFVSVTRDGKRFIYGNPNGGVAERFELYDLASDPGEHTNIAAVNAELVDSMKDEVERYTDEETNLHKRLVPEETPSAYTAEQMEKMANLGYLNPGSKRTVPDEEP